MRLLASAASALLLVGSASSSLSSFPSLRVPGLPPVLNECTNFTLEQSGVPPDAELGPAELIRGLQSFGDLSLFAPVHEKLKEGARTHTTVFALCPYQCFLGAAPRHQHPS